MFGYAKKTESSVTFLRNYAKKINSLLTFAEGNEDVTKKLVSVSEAFTFTVAPPENRSVKKCQKDIEVLYEKLYALLREDEWVQKEALDIIRDIEHKLGELGSYR
ncbi:MAG: hypothetical protein IJD59_00845 [Clostridia bacterium]|nr:hypothetical protein [Clostridia bacterium]